MDGFTAVFEDLDDPRTGNAARHDLLEILLIALCTVLCGGQTAVDMAEFAEAKEEFLREFLTLENGLPSHDTFSRIFRLLDPEQFSGCFGRFMARFAAEHGVIAIDGKVSRRSFDRASGKSALWIGVQKGPRYRGDRRSIGTPHFDGLDSDLVFQVARSGCW